MVEKKSSSVNCIRYALIFLHIFFLVVAILLVTLCVWILELPATNNAIAITTSNLHQNQIDRLSYTSIALGSAVILMSLFGFCGTMNNSKYTFFIMGFFMIVLLIAEIVVGVIAVLLQENIRMKMIPEMSRTLAFYDGDRANDALSVGWREAQVAFSCCGINTGNGFDNHTNVVYDYENSTLIGSSWYNREGRNIGRAWPESCCKVNSDSGAVDTTLCYNATTDLNKMGCHPQISRFIQNHILLFPLFYALLAIFQIAASALSFQMFKYARKRRTKLQSSS